MGFNKRYVDLESLKSFVKNGYPVSKIFDVDALIFMDKQSSKIYDLYTKGATDKELKELVENERDSRNQ